MSSVTREVAVRLGRAAHDAMSTLRSADRRNYAVTIFRNIFRLDASFDFLLRHSRKSRHFVTFSRQNSSEVINNLAMFAHINKRRNCATIA